MFDEPIDPPEGSEVVLIVADEQDLDDEDRARLHAALDRAREQIQRGETLDEEDFLARVHAKG